MEKLDAYNACHEDKRRKLCKGVKVFDGHCLGHGDGIELGEERLFMKDVFRMRLQNQRETVGELVTGLKVNSQDCGHRIFVLLLKTRLP